MTTEHAFPQALQAGDLAQATGGMTLRDYFAAHAPITYQDAVDWLDCFGGEVTGPWPSGRIIDVLSDLRMEYADAMLRARQQPAN